MPARPPQGSRRFPGVISGLNPAPSMPSLCSNFSKLNQNCDSTLWVQCKETLSWEIGREQPPPPFNRPLAPVEQEGEINTLRCPPQESQPSGPARCKPRGALREIKNHHKKKNQTKNLKTKPPLPKDRNHSSATPVYPCQGPQARPHLLVMDGIKGCRQV